MKIIKKWVIERSYMWNYAETITKNDILYTRYNSNDNSIPHNNYSWYKQVKSITGELNFEEQQILENEYQKMKRSIKLERILE